LQFKDLNAQKSSASRCLLAFTSHYFLKVNILSLSEALAALRNTYLGSFFLDPEDIGKMSLGAIWNFGGNRAPLF
jgi:hypothetical protein